MPTGDMIPWTISQQFNDNEFATLSGARIVRIATHPDVQKMGYGSRAVDLLISYFQGEFNDGMSCRLFVISFMRIISPQMRLSSSPLIQTTPEV
jgi:tRNA(Met) C34 N-acetyltransferase TmcA